MNCEQVDGVECTYEQCDQFEECFEITHLEVLSKDPTGRGFQHMQFHDRYGAKCSLQESSLATEAAIWFGIDDADPKIMARDYPEAGQTNGWVTYPIPDNVLLSTRMHLTQTQVRELLPYLQHFAEYGEMLCEEDNEPT